ncbi:MAG: hypothetical protein Q3979_05595 [Actinomycetaceae bacterium]|nr:hypothetical protein [Actinomycetaceae bacterium]
MRAPDVKKLVLDHLAETLGVPVASKRLDDGTAAYVLVLATGGAGRVDKIVCHVQLTLDSYGPTAGTAFDTANRVDAAMYGLPASTVPVASVRGSTPAYSPDPVSEQDRYTATYQITAKAT